MSEVAGDASTQGEKREGRDGGLEVVAELPHDVSTSCDHPATAPTKPDDDRDQHHDKKDEESVSKEELLALVRAIKFAKPDASQREVWLEITEELSQKDGFVYLATAVQLKDVKSVWKKAVKSVATDPSNNGDNSSSSNELMRDILGSRSKKGSDGDDVVQLYTVGDGSVATLASMYSQATAQKVIQEQVGAAVVASEQEAIRMQDYVHVFLNVPADKSGTKPHQALINFQDNNNNNNNSKSPNTNVSSKKTNSKKKKGRNSKKKGTSKDPGGAADEEAENTPNIVKIQIAVDASGVQHPMLLYNKDRSQRTFIHNTPTDGTDNEDDDGYQRIRKLIDQQGSGGALGAAGGSKAYFYALLSKQNGTEDIVSINVASLAPPQSW